jgi:signal transduction histidine kinase
MIVGDAARLRQAVTNLVVNAIKIGRPHGQLTVAAAIQDGWATVTVTDDGPGIAAADQRRIFQPFVQVAPFSRRRHQGAGLGLAIAGELVRLHGGRIEVESALGHGATFRVVLPLAARP